MANVESLDSPFAVFKTSIRLTAIRSFFVFPLESCGCIRFVGCFISSCETIYSQIVSLFILSTALQHRRERARERASLLPTNNIVSIHSIHHCCALPVVVVCWVHRSYVLQRILFGGHHPCIIVRSKAIIARVIEAWCGYFVLLNCHRRD